MKNKPNEEQNKGLQIVVKVTLFVGNPVSLNKAGRGD